MKKSVVSVGIVLAIVLLAICVLAGYTAQDAPTGEALTGTVPDNAAVLLFEPFGNTEIFVYTDSTTHLLAADGSRACSTVYPGQFAFLRGDTVTVACNQQELTVVQRFDAENFAETDFFGLEIPGDAVQFMETDGFGRLYVVLYSEPAEVLVFDAAGSYTGSLLYAESIYGLQVLDNTLFVLFSNSADCLALHTDFPQTGAETFFYPAYDRPYRLLSPDLYITIEGKICALDGTVMLDTGVKPSGTNLTALQNGDVFWASDGSTVSRMPLTGGTLALHPVRGTLEALTATAAVTRLDHVFYRTAYGEFTAAATPSPDAGATPSPAPISDELTFSESYLIAPEGMTCAKLRDTLSPSETQVYTQSLGAASGKLRTGWTAMIDGALYTIIVRGDINSTGTVNSTDLRLLQRYLAEDEELSDAALFAADLNADGLVDAADLVLLSARIGT